MSHIDVIRAWKDEEYRASLSADELAALPAHPAGLVELSDTELDAVAGGHKYSYYCGSHGGDHGGGCGGSNHHCGGSNYNCGSHGQGHGCGGSRHDCGGSHGQGHGCGGGGGGSYGGCGGGSNHHC